MTMWLVSKIPAAGDPEKMASKMVFFVTPEKLGKKQISRADLDGWVNNDKSMTKEIFVDRVTNILDLGDFLLCTVVNHHQTTISANFPGILSKSKQLVFPWLPFTMLDHGFP